LSEKIVSARKEVENVKTHANLLYYNNLPSSLQKALQSDPQHTTLASFSDTTVGAISLDIQHQSISSPAVYQRIASIFHGTLDKLVPKYEARKVDHGSFIVTVVSGCPVPHKFHFSEIATFAIHLSVQLQEKFKIEHLPATAKVGIATGTVVSGVGKSRDRLQYKIRGEPVQRALELLETCKESKIQIDSSVYELLMIDKKFSFENTKEAIYITGKSDFDPMFNF
jgi:hypothetical protein